MTTGETKAAGWQIGVSTTVHQPVDRVWELVSAPRGVAVWLGPGVRLSERAGERYRTDDGTTGEVRSFRPRDRVRVTARPPGWDHDTTIQVAVQDKGDKSTVRFHQERLSSQQERERQRKHWKAVAADLKAMLEG